MESGEKQKTVRRINFDGNSSSSQDEDGTPSLNISKGTLVNDEDVTPTTLLNVSQGTQLATVTGKTIVHGALSSPGGEIQSPLNSREVVSRNYKDGNLVKTVMHGPSSSPGEEMKSPLNFRKALARNNKEGGNLGKVVVHVSSSSPGEEIKSPLNFNEAALKNSQDGSYLGMTIDGASASPVKDDKLDVANTGKSLKRSAWTSPTSPTRNLCVYWTLAQKYCKYWDQCRFLHGGEDTPRLGRIPCPYLIGYEGCRYGTACVFKH